MHLYNCICVQIKKYKIWIKHLGQTGVRSTSNLQLPVRVKIHTYEAWSKACGRKSLSLRGTTPTMQSTNTFSFKYFHWLARLINQEHQPKRKLSRIYSIHDSACTYNGKAYLLKWGKFSICMGCPNKIRCDFKNDIYIWIGRICFLPHLFSIVLQFCDQKC